MRGLSVHKITYSSKLLTYPVSRWKAKFMLDLLKSLLFTGTSLLKTKQELALENLALRQQLTVLNRSAKRAKLTNADRIFWVTLIKVWPKWSDALVIVKPKTVNHLRALVREYIRHFHEERNHQGLDSELITPLKSDIDPNSKIKYRSRLGGILNYYYREVA